MRELEGKFKKAKRIKEAILDYRDRYGNTLLHIAARNENIEVYDHLIEMGADPSIKNGEGLTPFLTTARFGIWSMFNHIWDCHMTLTLWRFGNVEKVVINMSEVDWKGPVGFAKRTYFEQCLRMLMEELNELDLSEEKGAALNTDDAGDKNRGAARTAVDMTPRVLSQKLDELFREGKGPNYTDSNEQSSSKIDRVRARVRTWKEDKETRKIVKKYFDPVDCKQNECKHDPVVCEQNQGEQKIDLNQLKESDEEHDGRGGDSLGQALAAIRIITLFRPKDWYSKTKERIEHAVLQKWAQGFYLVHIGQTVIPYVIILLLFVLMWLQRQLSILEHEFWWASPSAVKKLTDANIGGLKILSNPVTANVSELQASLSSWYYGRSPSSLGLVPDQILGPESTCGWKSIAHSYSGNLQAALIIYAVPALLRLAFTQRRIRPSDLDENEDMKISTDEMINFIYFNLESFFHIINAGLFLTLGAARVSAGEQCNTFMVQTEKNCTCIAAVLLFFNLFVIFRPYEGIGLLVLTIYRFLVSDVFNFLLMYAILFVAFLLGLQTLHNANHIFLAWMDITEDIVPQVHVLKSNLKSS